MLKKYPLTNVHMARLAEYGLADIPLDACFCLRFSAGEEVLHEGDPIFRLSIVAKGSAKVCRTAPNGKSLILCYYISSGMIGEIELMTHQEISLSSVVAVTDFECITVSYQSCMAELKTNLFFLNQLGTGLAGKLAKSADNFTSSALCTGEQRLCSYILQTSRHNLFCETLTEVSCSIGLSYRHMFRLLGQLCEDGVLEKNGCGYSISDSAELMRRSHAVISVF